MIATFIGIVGWVAIIIAEVSDNTDAQAVFNLGVLLVLLSLVIGKQEKGTP